MGNYIGQSRSPPRRFVRITKAKADSFFTGAAG